MRVLFQILTMNRDDELLNLVAGYGKNSLYIAATAQETHQHCATQFTPGNLSCQSRNLLHKSKCLREILLIVMVIFESASGFTLNSGISFAKSSGLESSLFHCLIEITFTR